MSDFRLQTRGTVSPEGRTVLDKAQQGVGFVPNLIRVLAAAAHGYLDLGAPLDESSLSPEERQVVLLATRFARAAVEKRGRVSEEDLSDILEAGFEQRQVLDVLLGITMKTHGEGMDSGGVFFTDPDGICVEIFAPGGADGTTAPTPGAPTCGFF